MPHVDWPSQHMSVLAEITTGLDTIPKQAVLHLYVVDALCPCFIQQNFGQCAGANVSARNSEEADAHDGVPET